jgi:Ras-related protein Rab-1A
MSISPNKKNEYPAKLLILGDQGVGKTCIMVRFSDEMFPEHSTMTVGVDYKTKRIKIDDIEIKLTIWDTAG